MYVFLVSRHSATKKHELMWADFMVLAVFDIAESHALVRSRARELRCQVSTSPHLCRCPQPSQTLWSPCVDIARYRHTRTLRSDGRDMLARPRANAAPLAPRNGTVECTHRGAYALRVSTQSILVLQVGCDGQSCEGRHALGRAGGSRRCTST